MLIFLNANHPNHNFLFLGIFQFYGGGDITWIIPKARTRNLLKSDLQHSFKCIWVIFIIVHFSFYEGGGINVIFFAMDFKLCPWFMGAKSTNGNASPLYAKTYKFLINVLGSNFIEHFFSSTKGKCVSKSEVSIPTCILFF